jgi:membrane-bound lytic murein transglycosylase B
MLLRTLSFLIAATPQPAAPPAAPGGWAEALGKAAYAELKKAEPAVVEERAKVAAQAEGLTDAGFQAFIPELRRAALAAGVRADTLDRVLPTLIFSARAVQLDRAQPGGGTPGSPNPPFQPYLARHVTSALVSQARSRAAEQAAVLSDIQRRTGVDPNVIVAIWGKETGFGRVMGNFDLLNALASLAYEGRRRELFTGEFVATLKMLERGFPRSTLQGSYAGATGQSQFLPSVYLRLGVDGDGDGRADIWRSAPDALASIANYLKDAGWKANVPWGTEVTVPGSLDRASIANNLHAPRCPRVFEKHSRWLTMAEWRRLGLVPVGRGTIPDAEMASLLEPDGPGQPAYLVTNNFRVILDYNCSNYYGLVVSLLARGISG